MKKILSLQLKDDFKLTSFNNTKMSFPFDKTINELFEEQVLKTPKAKALFYEGKTFTYEELNKRANQLARTIRKIGINQEDVIGILIDRSLEMIIGMLAIMKAGAAFLPIDIGNNNEQIKHRINDTKMKLLLSKDFLKNKFSLGNTKILNLDDENNYDKNSDNLEIYNKPNNLAYIIYTSGSTGKQKGVMIEHRNLVNLCTWMIRDNEIKADDKVLKYINPDFDPFVLELFPALLSGASIYIVPEKLILDMQGLNNYIEKNKITLAIFPASIFEKFQHFNNKSLRKVIVGGDKFRITKKQNYQIENQYGPAECTCGITSYYSKESEIDMPIGKPNGNTRIYITDSENNLVPIGTYGEICVAGEQVGRGYLNQPKLTAEKFIDNPFEKNGKLYKTGDIGRWLDNGNIEFLGRNDNQVKIRSKRVELGEIEKTLREYPGIKNLAVVAKTGADGHKYLTAFMVSDEKIRKSDLKKYATKKLNDYMIPKSFVQINELPLTANGKVDRKSLSAEPNEIDKKIIAIWEKLLNKKDIKIHDNFFKLGGDSLQVIEMITLATKQGLKLDPGIIYENPTIFAISKKVEIDDTKIQKMDPLKFESKEKDVTFSYLTRKDLPAALDCIVESFVGETSNKDKKLMSEPMLKEINMSYDEFKYILEKYTANLSDEELGFSVIAKDKNNKVIAAMISEDFMRQEPDLTGISEKFEVILNILEKLDSQYKKDYFNKYQKEIPYGQIGHEFLAGIRESVKGTNLLAKLVKMSHQKFKEAGYKLILAEPTNIFSFTPMLNKYGYQIVKFNDGKDAFVDYATFEFKGKKPFEAIAKINKGVYLVYKPL